MDVKLEDRPIEQVRNETVDHLIHNYSHGIISAEAFERRLDHAMDSDDHQAIVDLVADLPLRADSQYQQRKASQFTPNYRAGNAPDTLKLTSILSDNNRGGQWVVPEVIEVKDVIGATTLDFTNAVFQHQHVTIKVLCVLGSETIYVPEQVNVVSQMQCILGSVEDKSASLSNQQGPTITIEGQVWLGSVEVKVKRTTKETLMGFANTLKALFGDDGMGNKHY